MSNDASSHGLWERTAPPAPVCNRLESQQIADVAIIGGGYTGLSAALHLAEMGAKVCLLEAESFGFGGSGRNVGLVNAGMWVRPGSVVDELGETYGTRLLTLLGGAPQVVFSLVERHAIACEATPVGTLHCGVGAAGEKELAARAAEWQALGAPVELLDAGHAAEATGTDVYRAALLDHRAGTIQPLAYARGLAAAALKAGARLYAHSAVLTAEKQSDGWRLGTAQGSVTARKVIVATNAYTSTLWPQLRAELVHLPYFNFATAPLPPAALARILPGRHGCWDTKEVLTSFRLDAAGRLIVGSVGALRGTGTAIHKRWARDTLRRLFPWLAFPGFETGWYGMIGMTGNALPRFHRPDEGVLSFSGYNGRGIAPGTVFGRVLAEHLAGSLADDMLPLPLTEPEEPRFRLVRERFYEYGAQVAHLTARV